MSRKRLTEDSVLALPLKRSAYRVHDYGPDAAKNLHVLVQAGTGTKSYFASYRNVRGQRRNAKLGRVGEVSLATARIKAGEVLKAAKLGNASSATRTLAADRPDPPTFKAMFAYFTTQEQKASKALVSADQSEQFVFSSTTEWHGRLVATITKEDVKSLLYRKRAKAPWSANRLHRHLKTFFSWCAEEDFIVASPMPRKPPFSGEKRRQRDWFRGTRADDVVRGLWRYADRIGGDPGKFIKLLIVTGKRRTVVQKMNWRDIDRDWMWRPPSGSRSKRNHEYPCRSWRGRC